MIRRATYGKRVEPLPSYLPTDIRQSDPDLLAVAEAWPELPEAIRAGILAMVRAASGRD